MLAQWIDEETYPTGRASRAIKTQEASIFWHNNPPEFAKFVLSALGVNSLIVSDRHIIYLFSIEYLGKYCAGHALSAETSGSEPGVKATLETL